MQGYVNGFLFDKKFERVVLIRKERPEWQKGLLNGVGGKIEEDETPNRAMIREFDEETGKFFSEWYEFSVMEVNDSKLHFFAGVGEVDDVQTTTEEEVVVEDVSEISDLQTIPNLNWLVPMAEIGIRYQMKYEIER